MFKSNKFLSGLASVCFKAKSSSKFDNTTVSSKEDNAKNNLKSNDSPQSENDNNTNQHGIAASIFHSINSIATQALKTTAPIASKIATTTFSGTKTVASASYAIAKKHVTAENMKSAANTMYDIAAWTLKTTAPIASKIASTTFSGAKTVASASYAIAKEHVTAENMKSAANTMYDIAAWTLKTTAPIASKIASTTFSGAKTVASASYAIAKECTTVAKQFYNSNLLKSEDTLKTPDYYHDSKLLNTIIDTNTSSYQQNPETGIPALSSVSEKRECKLEAADYHYGQKLLSAIIDTTTVSYQKDFKNRKIALSSVSKKHGFKLQDSSAGFFYKNSEFNMYQSDVFVNEADKTVIISNPGTKIGLVGVRLYDIINDLQLLLGYTPSKVYQAKSFIDQKVTKIVSECVADPDNGPGTWKVIFTGHSLGAVISDLSAVHFHKKTCEGALKECIQISSLTIENPGSKNLIQDKAAAKDVYFQVINGGTNIINSIKSQITSKVCSVNLCPIKEQANIFKEDSNKNILKTVIDFLSCADHPLPKFRIEFSDNNNSEYKTMYNKEDGKYYLVSEIFSSNPQTTKNDELEKFIFAGNARPISEQLATRLGELSTRLEGININNYQSSDVEDKFTKLDLNSDTQTIANSTDAGSETNSCCDNELNDSEFNILDDYSITNVGAEQHIEQGEITEMV
ncbi:lipase family protein [Rickettsia endosymbiont of Cardiosporidium cionae]|uniref:lipase family protein n=1 Tax=Rickettsia endosymbiont of Cardiosporidium cionae TaxID=2777155 RepID=UPI001894FA75|nr:hypothetical protein [Rickettsia endosymbiont of Cardiosporidium cionae]KAF8818648.1 hypothetical protein IHI24_000370 [Rickettsia endosymbiont of Cardiosporidium cionae]